MNTMFPIIGDVPQIMILAAALAFGARFGWDAATGILVFLTSLVGSMLGLIDPATDRRMREEEYNRIYRDD